MGLGRRRAEPAAGLDMSAIYRDVDRSSDPGAAAVWMDHVAAYPGIADGKRRAADLLAPVGPVLDVGCGLGEDLRRLPDGSVGLDASATMLAIARSRGGTYVRGDGSRLPFIGGAFGGARADRILQHVDDPDAVAAELVRVVASGGLVVVLDPDQATLRIEGTDPELTPVMVAYRAAGLRHGFLAGSMADVLRAAGCGDVAQQRFATVLRDPADAFGIGTWAELLADNEVWSAADAARFDRSLAAAAAAGTFRYAVDLVLTYGTVRRGGGRGGGRGRGA